MAVNRLLIAIASAALMSFSGAALSKDTSEELPADALYRYTNSDGRMVIRSTLPREAIYTGYEIVDSQGRVLKTVEKALPEEERIKLREKHRALERDRDLVKLYPTPKDAERARDRQISAIQLKITYAQNNISQLNNKLNDEVSSAANYEKAGNDIPENTKKSIDSISRQIRDEEAKIANFETDIGKISREFEGIINRIQEINAEKRSAAK